MNLIEVKPIVDAIELARGIVEPSDITMLNLALPSVQVALARDTIFRTEDQMRVSVLNDTRHPTASDKIAQAHREIIVHAQELFELACEYHLKIIDLEEYEDKLENGGITDEYERRRTEVKVAQARFHLAQMSRVAHHRIREVATWSKILDELKTQPETPEIVSLAVRFCRETKAMEDMGASFPPADARNIYGLLYHSVKEVEHRGLLKEFLDAIGDDRSMIEWCIRKKILVKEVKHGGYSR